MKHLTKKYFDNIIVSYRSLKEQQKISRKLDLLCELISMRQEQLEELNLLVKSRFNEMFGDFYTTLFPKYKIGEKFELLVEVHHQEIINYIGIAERLIG